MSQSTSIETMVRIAHNQALEVGAVLKLYRAVGWTQYAADPELLMRAINGSQAVFSAHVGDALVGLLRCVTDSVSVVYIQDLLVDPAHQRKGVGRALMNTVEKTYEDVRLKLLLTDDTPQQVAFYEALNFTNTRTLKKRPLNAFLRISNQTLE